MDIFPFLKQIWNLQSLWLPPLDVSGEELEESAADIKGLPVWIKQEEVATRQVAVLD